jgi:aspartyl/asparaginyl-tRNA synthetase
LLSFAFQVISQQYPFEPLKYLRPGLRITFQEGITLLREAGFDAPYDDDISTPHEKALGGQLIVLFCAVKERE